MLKYTGSKIHKSKICVIAEQGENHYEEKSKTASKHNSSRVFRSPV